MSDSAMPFLDTIRYCTLSTVEKMWVNAEGSREGWYVDVREEL